MLQVNLDVLDFQVEQSIKRDCSKLGGVRMVRFHRSPAPFALIHMTTGQQTHELASRFGGSAFGTCALIHLNHLSGNAAVE